MKNSKEKALKFIEVLKAMKLEYLSVDESFSPDLEYSICISGKINTDLFIVKFAKFKTFGKHEMKIYDSTSCKDQITEILNSL